MIALNEFLSETFLGEEYRKPLIDLQNLCVNLGLDDDDIEIVFAVFIKHTQKVYDFVKLREDFNRKNMVKIESCSRALLALRSGEDVSLKAKGFSINVSEFRDEMSSLFTQILKDSFFTEKDESDFTEEQLLKYISLCDALKEGDKPQVRCGEEINQIRNDEDWDIAKVLSKLETKTAQNILIGEILYASGSLKRYGFDSYWKYAPDNKSKSDNIRNWEKEYMKKYPLVPESDDDQ